ncbi:MAG: Soluble cytochrome b558 [candidate division WS6 bacterium OLB20]|uniref:Soluble cytochrome b558 n=1 Tax=candidate division WS6 bacterium OLB20 TaxID=1617426 RepID=A0A136LWQ9_9BACT|nr:MAG: Soluble cytochrome b558 [candidate division WS6 bacterium OLB20]
MKYILITMTLVIALTACTPAPQNSPSADRQISRSELALHNTADDCWLAIDGRVYDVTSYVVRHPGGAEQITRGCGQDATQLFATQGGQGSHSANAVSIRDSFIIGVLAD